MTETEVGRGTQKGEWRRGADGKSWSLSPGAGRLLGMGDMVTPGFLLTEKQKDKQ